MLKCHICFAYSKPILLHVPIEQIHFYQQTCFWVSDFWKSNYRTPFAREFCPLLDMSHRGSRNGRKCTLQFYYIILWQMDTCQTI